jgi:DNA-binding response OmpR family regulator
LTRDKIEQQIYDFGFEGGSNVIDVYIRYLRKKIDQDFKPKLIHTVRGTGYVLRTGD